MACGLDDAAAVASHDHGRCLIVPIKDLSPGRVAVNSGLPCRVDDVGEHHHRQHPIDSGSCRVPVTNSSIASRTAS